MSDPAPVHHPPELHRLCQEAIDAFRALPAADLHERGAKIPAIRALLERIDQWVEETDLLDPAFAREQGWLVDASSALQSIDLDRGGPHVERYVERAAADLRRVAGS